MDRRSPPRLSAGSPSSPSGGFDSASFPDRIEPGHPEQNGRHERMHRTLKAEATQPPARKPARAAANLRPLSTRVQPRPTSRGARPEAAGQRIHIFSATYADDVGIPGIRTRRRCVHRRPLGLHRWKISRVADTPLLTREPVGARWIEDGKWELRYGPIVLGVIDERRKEPRPRCFALTRTCNPTG
jgi:hypothetical protein